MSPQAARDKEEFLVRNGVGEWVVSWHPPGEVPDGTPHGANAICVTSEGDIVLVSEDGKRFGWPGGRPEGDEDWEQTLRREILEEACATVGDARLLGFCRATCVAGAEEGLVLVRSLWRAKVTIEDWEPRFEVVDRIVVPVGELLDALWMEPGFDPIYYRAFAEAQLALNREVAVDAKPRIEAALVEEFVVAAHGDLDRTRELLGSHPALANAAWDWGGGDFETALGGASHMGRRDIALMLLDAGARLDIFAAAMLGYVDVVRAAVAERPDVVHVLGPHGIPLVAHAEAGGEHAAKVLAFLKDCLVTSR